MAERPAPPVATLAPVTAPTPFMFVFAVASAPGCVAT